jgi:hypothetical protein
VFFLSAITSYRGNTNGVGVAPVQVVWRWPDLVATLGTLALFGIVAMMAAA